MSRCLVHRFVRRFTAAKFQNVQVSPFGRGDNIWLEIDFESLFDEKLHNLQMSIERRGVGKFLDLFNFDVINKKFRSFQMSISSCHPNCFLRLLDMTLLDEKAYNFKMPKLSSEHKIRRPELSSSSRFAMMPKSSNDFNMALSARSAQRSDQNNRSTFDRPFQQELYHLQLSLLRSLS
ncbi:unnamed protein product [Aphanomyces euteiches]